MIAVASPLWASARSVRRIWSDTLRGSPRPGVHAQPGEPGLAVGQVRVPWSGLTRPDRFAWSALTTLIELPEDGSGAFSELDLESTRRIVAGPVR